MESDTVKHDGRLRQKHNQQANNASVMCVRRENTLLQRQNSVTYFSINDENVG
jgi:hypothetical protein